MCEIVSNRMMVFVYMVLLCHGVRMCQYAHILCMNLFSHSRAQFQRFRWLFLLARANHKKIYIHVYMYLQSILLVHGLKLNDVDVKRESLL